VQRIGVEERRIRLAVRHHLAPSALAADPVEATRGVVALHSTTASSVFLSAAARMQVPEVAALERALYDDRVLVRMLGMRRTVFVVPVDLMPVVHAACTRAIAVQERKRAIQFLAGAGITDDGGPWLDDLERVTLAALEARGEATTAELSKTDPRLELRINFAAGKAYAGSLGVGSRVMFLLAADGRIVRGRPRGSWASSQHRWAPIGTWLREPVAHWSTAAAQVELVRRWLASFGPGTIADLRWWTGLTAREIHQALASIDHVEVDLEGATGIVLAEDQEPPAPIEPWVALLPGLDPTPMGWTAREWFLGPHAKALFDRSGNIGPTIWSNGRIVGGWAQRPDGQINFRLLEDVGREAETQVADAAERLRLWIGDIRVTPGFRTPLERELSAS
jgi:hypothetical protein